MARTGEKLRLECEVESVPESAFTWTKDGKPIKESQDILVTKIKNKSKANLISTNFFRSRRIIKNLLWLSKNRFLKTQDFTSPKQKILLARQQPLAMSFSKYATVHELRTLF